MQIRILPLKTMRIQVVLLEFLFQKSLFSSIRFIYLFHLFKAAATWATAEGTRRGVEITPQLQREILGPAMFLVRERDFISDRK